MTDEDTPAWRAPRGLRAYRAAWESGAAAPAFEDGTAFPARVQSEANLAANDPWRIEAWENPFARDGPASPFPAGEAMLEAEGSATAPPLAPFLAGVGARVAGLRLLDGSPIVKIERDGRAARVRVTKDGPLLAGGGFRLRHDRGPEAPREIARLTGPRSVSGGPAPRQGWERWARNGSFRSRCRRTGRRRQGGGRPGAAPPPEAAHAG